MKKNFVRPEVYITIGKDRKKVYGSNTVYLENKQEFEFEFFNPLKDNIMAMISINGNPISNRGLILRPGMRGYLDRFINEDKRFLFETYTVDGNSEAVKKAIEDNGEIIIQFFKEKQNTRPALDSLQCSTGTVTYRDGCGTLTTNTSNYKQFCGDVEMDYSAIDNAPEELSRGFVSKRKLSKKVETGRVEKGSVSGQQFSFVDMKFETFPLHTVIYKLLPISQKPAEFNELKLKCHKCGAKVKSNWKVCPICATPINGKCKCPKCQTKVEPVWKVCPMCGETL